MTTTGMGEVVRDGERVGLRFRRSLGHRPEKVWRAITESEHLQYWLPCDIIGERRAGADVRLSFWPDHVQAYSIEEAVLDGTITAWQPPRLFAWTWGGDQLRFELKPTEAGTELIFTTWLEDADPAAAAGAAGGYHVCLDHLARLLDDEAKVPLTDPSVQPAADRWTSMYADLLAATT